MSELLKRFDAVILKVLTASAVKCGTKMYTCFLIPGILQIINVKKGIIVHFGIEEVNYILKNCF